MQRLTERNKNGLAMAACCGKACEYNYCCEVGGFSDCKGIDDIIDRLADIEDVLGDEYDLDRLRELVEADKAGRCVVLPCKVGDVVWFTRAWYSVLNKPLEGRVTSIREVHGAIASFEATVTGVGPAIGSSRRFDSDMIGKTVFLDYAEAESALEKMKEGKV